MRIMAKYPFLSAHLLAQGFQVYPKEMVCGSIGCRHEANRLVDVAAKKEGYYAFEYKSNGDHILRALPQVENYGQSFDYVVIVVEVPRTEISLDLRRGVRIKEFERLGAGIWTVKFDYLEKEDAYGQRWMESTNPRFQVLIEPSLQIPHPKNKEWIRLKFEHYGRRMPLLKRQVSEIQRELTDYQNF